MNGERQRGIHWGGVALGWLVAAVSGVAISLLLGALYGLVLAHPAKGDGVGATVSGFLAYLLGGFVAGRTPGRSGGLNGALTAILGLIVGVAMGFILAPSGVALTWAVATPPANFGPGGSGRFAGLLLFLANLFGGYVGGELGEPPRPNFE